MIHGFEIDILGEVEMPDETVEAVATLLVGQRTGQNIDAVACHGSHHEVAAAIELRLAELFRLAMDLAAMADADIGGKKKIGRIGARDAGPRQPAADRDIRLSIGAEPVGIVHAVDMSEHHIADRLQRRRQQPRHGRRRAAPGERQHLDLTKGEGKGRDGRRIPGCRETAAHDVGLAEPIESAPAQILAHALISPLSPSPSAARCHSRQSRPSH